MISKMVILSYQFSVLNHFVKKENIISLEHFLLAGNFSPQPTPGGCEVSCPCWLMHLLLPYDEMRAMPLLPSFLMLFTPRISTLFLSASRSLQSLGTPVRPSEQGGLFLAAAPMAQQLQSSSTQVLFFHLFFYLSHFREFRGRGEVQRNKNRG